jgi:rhodanese-related sulfurtransferase
MSWGRRVPEATVQDLAADDDPNKLVIDVREPMETMHGTVEGAWLVPLGQLDGVSTRSTTMPTST